MIAREHARVALFELGDWLASRGRAHAAALVQIWAISVESQPALVVEEAREAAAALRLAVASSPTVAAQDALAAYEVTADLALLVVRRSVDAAMGGESTDGAFAAATGLLLTRCPACVAARWREGARA